MACLLIVDDDPQTIQVLQRYAEQQVMGCWTATSVDQALQSLNEHRPELILADIHVDDRRPHAADHRGKSGFEVLRAAKALLPKSTVILITNAECCDEFHAATARTLGADGFLTKPFTCEDMSVYLDLSSQD